MTAPIHSDTLTVLYDGGCPLCRREIAHVQRLAQGSGPTGSAATVGAGLCFVDISADAAARAAAGTAPSSPSAPALSPDERRRLLARFHVQRADGSRLSGAAAFVEMWSRLPGWRWAARVARLPGLLPVLEGAYRVFLRLRPALQGLARRWEAQPKPHPATAGVESGGGGGGSVGGGVGGVMADLAAGSRRDATAVLSKHLERELRSDHAGETGAVCIYRGIAAVARWRGDAALLDFARRHGDTEAEHLRLVETWLPPAQRSRLLGPWRLAGWLTGALPALAGARAVHGTIAAVETFVDHHYQQQIDHLLQHGGPPGLLPLLQRCQADEQHHRDEARALAPGPGPLLLRAWCAVVGAGSAAAVVVARRV